MTTNFNRAYAIRDQFIAYLESNPIPARHNFGGIPVVAYVAGGSAFNYIFSKNANLTVPSNWNYLKTPDVDLKFMAMHPLNDRDRQKVKTASVSYMENYLQGFRRWIVPRLAAPQGTVLSLSNSRVWQYNKETYHQQGWADGFTGNYLYSLYGFYVSYPSATQPGVRRRIQFLDLSVGENPSLREDWLYRRYPITTLHPQYMFRDQAYIIIASFLSRDTALLRRSPFANVTNPFTEMIRLKGEKDMKRLLLLAKHFMGTTTKGYKAILNLYNSFFTARSVNKYRAHIHLLRNLLKSNKAINTNNTNVQDNIMNQFMLFASTFVATSPPAGDHVYLAGGMGIRIMMAHLNQANRQMIPELNKYMVEKTDDFDFKYMVPRPITTLAELNTKIASMNQFYENLFRLFAARIGANLIITQLFPGQGAIQLKPSRVTPTKTMYYLRTYKLQINGREYEFADTSLYHDSNFNANQVHAIGGIPVLKTDYMLKDTLEVVTRSILAPNGSYNARRNPINGSNALKGYKNLRRAGALTKVLRNYPGVIAIAPHLGELKRHVYNKNTNSARSSARTIRTMIGYT